MGGPPTKFIGAAQATNTAAGVGARRLTFAPPAALANGDMVIVIIASPAVDTVLATSVAWTAAGAVVSAAARAMRVYYRIAAGEPSSYTFDLQVSQESIGALLVYRDVDTSSAPRGLAVVDVTGTSSGTVLPCPSQVATRYSDLYVGVGFFNAPTTPDFQPTGTERLEFSQNALGGGIKRIDVFDIGPDIIGAIAGKSIYCSSPSTGETGTLGSFMLAGLPAPGTGIVFSPLVPGAIGLPEEGI